MFPSRESRSYTFVPRVRELQNVDELGVESRGHLHTHTAGKKTEIHPPKLRFFVPFDRILGRNLGDNRI